MALTPINPNIPNEQLIAMINQNFQEINQSLYVTLLQKDEAGTQRIIFGRLPDGTHGLVISKEGTDVVSLFE